MKGDTRDAVFAAAAEAFSARGFAGTGVDRIAAAARVNKAMIYYHFGSKRGLYTAVLADMFTAVADTVTGIPGRALPPVAALESFIDGIAGAAATRPHFPAIWLREIADEGRHLDPSLAPIIGRVLETLAGILGDGQRRGIFKRVHPLLVQFGIIGPMLVFLASSSARARLLEHPSPLAPLSDEEAITHIKRSTIATVLVDSHGEPS